MSADAGKDFGVAKWDPKGPVWGIFTQFEFALDQP
jgi:hypothetical protein